MKNSPFSPELRTLRFVPRWCIMATNGRDTVAAHTFYVMTYARIVADLIEWKGPIDYVYWQAAMHDVDETISGDIPGPAKKHIVDEAKSEPFLFDKMDEKFPGMLDLSEKIITDGNWSREADQIVAVADKLDALLYLVGESRLGNSCVDKALDGNMKSLEGAWRSLPAPIQLLDSLWQTVVTPSIKAHYSEGGRGV